MSPKPDYDRLYETAEGQAGYFTAKQAKKHGFSWERLSDNVKRGLFYAYFAGFIVCRIFPVRLMKICLWPGYEQALIPSSRMRAL